MQRILKKKKLNIKKASGKWKAAHGIGRVLFPVWSHHMAG